MTMKSYLSHLGVPTRRATSWIVAGVCAAAVATGLTIADTDLASLQRDRNLVATDVSARAVTLHDLEVANAALSEQLADSRNRIATLEQALSSRAGLLP